MQQHIFGLVLALLVITVPGPSAAVSNQSGPRGQVPATATDSDGPWRWAAYYRGTASPEDLRGYHLLVLDPDDHPPIAPLVDRGQMVLAYVSLTEVGEHRDFYERLRRAGALLDRHPQWRDAHFIDIRKPAWGALLVEHVVPRVLAGGFDGVFLDTLDDAAHLEETDPKRHLGMKAAAISLVRTIRRHYPSIRLMVNRGYGVMPQIARDIDFVLGESVEGSFDSDTKAYRRVSTADVEWQVEQLRDAARRNPRLRVLTLDYWSPDDPEGVRALYRSQRERGFSPYVATPLLDQVVKEPQ